MFSFAFEKIFKNFSPFEKILKKSKRTFFSVFIFRSSFNRTNASGLFSICGFISSRCISIASANEYCRNSKHKQVCLFSFPFGEFFFRNLSFNKGLRTLDESSDKILARKYDFLRIFLNFVLKNFEILNR